MASGDRRLLAFLIAAAALMASATSEAGDHGGCTLGQYLQIYDCVIFFNGMGANPTGSCCAALAVQVPAICAFSALAAFNATAERVQRVAEACANNAAPAPPPPDTPPSHFRSHKGPWVQISPFLAAVGAGLVLMTLAALDAYNVCPWASKPIHAYCRHVGGGSTGSESEAA